MKMGYFQTIHDITRKRDYIVNSQLVILPNLRHSILIEAPDEVVDHFLQF